MNLADFSFIRFLFLYFSIYFSKEHLWVAILSAVIFASSTLLENRHHKRFALLCIAETVFWLCVIGYWHIARHIFFIFVMLAAFSFSIYLQYKGK